MTEKQIIDALATRVMGWTRGKYIEEGVFIADYWYDDNEEFVAWARDWDSIDLIEYAWQIVEKFKSGDPILRAKFAVLLPVLIYKLEPRDICLAALEVVA